MNRQEKEKAIEQLKADFANSQASIVVDYKGLTVSQMSALRKNLRQSGASLKVAKLTLVKRALSDNAAIAALSDRLKEQLAIVFIGSESPAVAKALLEFSKKHEKLDVIAGSLQASILTKSEILELAKLPSKEVLIAQLLGTLQAPVTGLVCVLNMLVLRLLFVLKEIENKKAVQ